MKKMNWVMMSQSMTLAKTAFLEQCSSLSVGLNGAPPQRYVHSECVNAILFGETALQILLSWGW